MAVFLVRALGALLLIGGALLQYRYGALQDPEAIIIVLGIPISYGLGLLMVGFSVFKYVTIYFAVAFWCGGRKTVAFISGALGLTMATAGFFGTAGFQMIVRVQLKIERASHEMSRDDVRKEIVGIEQRLLAAGWSRPVAQVEAEIRADQRDPRWIASNECRKVVTASTRAYCARLDRLAGELAGAQEAQKLREREDELRAQLRTAAVERIRVGPDVLVIQWILGASAEWALVIRTGVIAFLFELKELGIVWLLAQIQATRQSASTPAQKRRSRVAGRRAARTAAAIAIARPALRTDLIGARPSPSRPGETPPHLGEGALVHPPHAEATHPISRQSTGSELPSGAISPERAMQRFVALLGRGPRLRPRGSELAQFYEALRAQFGGPALPSNLFG